jgi:hypothetical protein
MSAKYYFYLMKRKYFSVIFFFCFSTGILSAQTFVRTSELFQRDDPNSKMGELVIKQGQSLDTLISRHIMANKNLFNVNNHYGMNGFRIQIYASNNRNARKESDNARQEFIDKFPDVVSYSLYAEPGYFKIRVGDFRTKTEATKQFQMISKEFPDAYIVPDVINFPDLNIK